MITDKTILLAASRVVMGEDTGVRVTITSTDDIMTVAIGHIDGRVLAVTTTTADDWRAALRKTPTVRGWALAAVNAVIGEALNSGDGVYRP